MTVVVVGLALASMARAQQGFTFPDSADYSALTWTDAFKAVAGA